MPISIDATARSPATGAGTSPRTWAHTCAAGAKLLVADVDATVALALAQGATLERAAHSASWGRIAGLVDPFGHGLCVLSFLNRGYDEVATSA